MVTPYNTRGSALLKPPGSAAKQIPGSQVVANRSMPGRETLAAAGRAVQQGPANYAGMATKAGFKPPPRPAAPPPVQQPRQGMERAFRAVMSGAGNAYGKPQPPQTAALAPTQAAPPSLTAVTQFGPTGLNNVKNTTMGAGGFGGSMRSDINVPGRTSSNPVAGMSVLGGAVPTQQGGAGSVQTRVDALTKDQVTNSAPGVAAQWLQDQIANLTGYDSENPPERRIQVDAPDSTNEFVGRVSNPVIDPGNIKDVLNPPGGDAGGEGSEYDPTKPDSLLEMLLRSTMGGLKNSVFDPSADFADQLNNSAKEKIPGYYNNWEDLKDLRNSGKELLGNEYYDSYDAAARDQLQSDVSSNRDAMMRQALSQSYGGGRGMGGNFAGQVADSSARALAEGNRGIAMDSMQRRLQGKQIGGAQEQAAVGMIYDLMNQGYTDPREIFSAILEMAPEMAGALGGILDSILPG